MKKNKKIVSILVFLVILFSFGIIGMSNRWQCPYMNIMPNQSLLSEHHLTIPDNQYFVDSIKSAFGKKRHEFVYKLIPGHRSPPGTERFNKPYLFQGIMACTGSVMIVSANEFEPDQQILSIHYRGSKGKREAQKIRTTLLDTISEGIDR